MGETKVIQDDNSNDLVLTFKNDFQEELFIVIDPPCGEFVIRKGSYLKLIIFDYKSSAGNVSDIVDVRYEENCLNVDVNYNFKLGINIDGQQQIIWRLSKT